MFSICDRWIEHKKQNKHSSRYDMAYIHFSFVYMCIYIHIQICIFVTEYILSKEKILLSLYAVTDHCLSARQIFRSRISSTVFALCHSCKRAYYIDEFFFYYDYIQLVCMNVSFLLRLLSRRRKKREEKKRKTESGWQTNAESYSCRLLSNQSQLRTGNAFLSHIHGPQRRFDVCAFLIFLLFSFLFFFFFVSFLIVFIENVFLISLYFSFATDDLAINSCCCCSRWHYHYYHHHYCSIWFFDMVEENVVLLGLMEWNAVASTTTTEICYELLSDVRFNEQLSNNMNTSNNWFGFFFFILASSISTW